MVKIDSSPILATSLSGVIYLIIFSLNMSHYGFLSGHSGFAGPHFLATILNFRELGAFVDEVFVIGNDSYVRLYDHHPKLFFLISNVLLGDGTMSQILNRSYLLANVYNILGLLSLQIYVFKSTGRYSRSLLALLLMLSTYNIVENLNLFTFDSLSILSAVIIYNIYHKMLSGSKRTALDIASVFIVLSISAYNYIIIAFLFGVIIIKDYKEKKLILRGEYVVALLAFISWQSIYTGYDGAYNLVDKGGTRGFGSYAGDGLGVEELFKFLIKSVPLGLLLIKIKLSTIDRRYFMLFFGIIIFILIDIKWNLAHQFVSMYIASFIIILISIYGDLTYRKYLAIFIFSLPFTLLYFNYKRNRVIVQETRQIVAGDRSLYEFDSEGRMLVPDLTADGFDSLSDVQMNGGQLRFLCNVHLTNGVKRKE